MRPLDVPRPPMRASRSTAEPSATATADASTPSAKDQTSAFFFFVRTFTPGVFFPIAQGKERS